MSNKVYDVLKWVAQYLLPALGTLYFALAGPGICPMARRWWAPSPPWIRSWGCCWASARRNIIRSKRGATRANGLIARRKQDATV